MDTKICTGCDQTLSLSSFKTSKPRCADCQRAYWKAWNARPDVRARQRVHRLRTLLAQYGLDIEHYEQMLRAQDGVCAICRQLCKTGRNLAVDHDHQTGVTRGLLCAGCNFLVGSREHGRNQRPEVVNAMDAYLRVYGFGNPILPAEVGRGPLPSRRRVAVVKPKNPDWAAKRLSRDQVSEIRRRDAAGEARKALAREFGVASSTVIRIVSGQLWPNV